mgnify:CR=1 FL=1
MKKTIYLILIVISVFGFAQQGANPFAEPEYQNAFSKEQATKENAATEQQSQPYNKDIGNPGDPAPIDDYVPLLVIAAIGIIVYTQRETILFRTNNH